MLATGGIITTLKTDKGIERIHVFNSTDKFRIIYGGKFRILIVGAGENGGTGLGSSADCGQGWRIAARGGGGGGVIDTEIISGCTEMDMIVGSGSGQASSAFGLTAYGGLNGSSGAPTNFTGGQTVVQWCSTRLRQACGAGAKEEALIMPLGKENQVTLLDQLRSMDLVVVVVGNQMILDKVFSWCSWRD
jgi:hypothetical protein